MSEMAYWSREIQGQFHIGANGERGILLVLQMAVDALPYMHMLQNDKEARQ